MASIGHVIFGLAAARFVDPAAPMRQRLYTAIGLATLSLAPDLDVIAFRFGIPYEAPFGHRGASHSLVFAVLFGAAIGALWRREMRRPKLVIPVCAVLVATHGLLDMLTDGGEGVALAWPFSNARMFFPWQPLPVAPIGRALLSARGLYVFAVEMLWFAPLVAYGLWPPRRVPITPASPP